MNSPSEPSFIGIDPIQLRTHYEAARALAVGDRTQGLAVVGLTVLYRWGVPAWMQAVQNATPHPDPMTGTYATRCSASVFGSDTATIVILASMLLALSKESSQCTPQPN